MYRYESDLRKEILSVPDMARFLQKSMRENAKLPFISEELKKFKNVVITGCGDSLCAAYAAKEAFEELTGLFVDTPTCLDLARHYDVRRFGEPGDTLVILVSFSGKVSRVVEAAMRAKKYGAVTMAVTHFEDSPVAEACDRLLHVVPDEFDLHRTPGCRTYVASMLSLFHFAIHLGETIGIVLNPENYISEIDANIDLWDVEMDRLEKEMYELAESWKPVPYFEALGAGPEFATAWFAQAKLYEATGDFSRYENFEDWTHVDYILRRMDSGMFLYVTEENPSMSRAKEVASVLTRQNYHYIVVTDENKENFPESDKVINIPSSKLLWLNPMMQTLVPCMFAASLADLKGTMSFCKDMIETYFPFGGSILRNSKIEVF